MIFRTPWNAFPDVAVQTTVRKLKSHPDYDAAKAGDQDAALRVIDRVFKPGKVTDSCDLIVPVLQLVSSLDVTRVRAAGGVSRRRRDIRDAGRT